MKKNSLLKIVGGVLMFGLFSWTVFASAKTPAYPFPQEVAYKKSSSLSQYSQKTLEKNVANYYDIWKRDFLVKQKDLYRIASDKDDKSRTVSEGQGYGMMIVALMAGYDRDAQKIFDGLYHFAKKHPSEICGSFMTWQVPAKKGGSDSAFDGDADIAYALMLASKQWGNTGKVHYANEAKNIINALSLMAIGKESHLPLLGDWVEQNGKKYNQYTTRTSDFMPSHFRAFYRFTGDKKWLSVIETTNRALAMIQNNPTNKTALVSDFIYHDKQGYHPTKRKFLEEEDDSYYYNACRVPLRIGLDALLNGDKISQEISKSMLSWIVEKSGKNVANIKSGYRLSGQVIGDYSSAVFVAPFGVAAKLDASKQAFLDAIYEMVKSSHENYFEDSVNLLSQLVMIEAFWDPTTVK